MTVVADTELEPRPWRRRGSWPAQGDLVPLRHTFIADCETPVSAYLKLRGDGPSFLLESAEQGQRFGRWSFLGFRPRAVIRWQRGDGGDPYAMVEEELGRLKLAPVDGLPPLAGGAVGLFGYDLVRTFEPSVGEPNPDELGVPELAVMVAELLVAFDHLRHEVTVIANVPADELEEGYARAAEAVAEVRERLAGPVPRVAASHAEAPEWALEPRARTATPRRWSERRSTSAPATSTRWCPASAGARRPRWRPSRSTAACGPSTRARTCTSWTSRTSRSRAPHRSRW